MPEIITYIDNPTDPTDPLVLVARYRHPDDPPDATMTYRGLLARCWHDAVAEVEVIDKKHTEPYDR